MADPLDELIDPKVADPIPDKLENVLGASQYISPSYWLGEAMNLVIGTNPFQWAAEQFTGDWQAVQVAGKAVQSLAAFNEVFASRINSGSLRSATGGRAMRATPPTTTSAVSDRCSGGRSAFLSSSVGSWTRRRSVSTRRPVR
jgi:hypothetical protein